MTVDVLTDEFIRRRIAEGKPVYEDRENRNITKDKAQAIVQWNSLSFLLELYYAVAESAYRENTFEYLDQPNPELIDIDSETYALEHITLLDRAGKIGRFIRRSLILNTQLKAAPAKMLLRQVVHHVMLKQSLPPSQTDRLKSEFFPKSAPNVALWRQKDSE